MKANDRLLKRFCRFFFHSTCIFYLSNSVDSDSVVDGGGDGGAGGDDVMDVLDMMYVLDSNALGSNDGLDNAVSDYNALEKLGNMDVFPLVVLHNHARNRIAYFFLLSISI